MPRLLPLTHEQLSPEAIAAFERHIEAHKSRITNMKATMVRSPLVLDIYMRWYDLYEEIKIFSCARVAYLFAYAISSGSNCPLCTTYFRKILIENGENPAELQLSEIEQIIVDFGSALATNKGEVPDEIYEPIRNNFTETEIVILSAFAGQMVATNIFNNILQVEIDEYLLPFTSFNKSTKP
jgi:hypothetical protein